MNQATVVVHKEMRQDADSGAGPSCGRLSVDTGGPDLDGPVRGKLVDQIQVGDAQRFDVADQRVPSELGHRGRMTMGGQVVFRRIEPDGVVGESDCFDSS